MQAMIHIDCTRLIPGTFTGLFCALGVGIALLFSSTKCSVAYCHCLSGSCLVFPYFVFLLTYLKDPRSIGNLLRFIFMGYCPVH